MSKIKVPDKPKRKIEVISEYVFHYLIYFSHKTESCIDIPYETHAFHTRTYYSRSIHRIVVHFTRSFHDAFQEAYEYRLSRPFSNDLDYTSYAVSICRHFMDQDFQFLQEEMSNTIMPYFFFLMSAAFVFHLEKFSNAKGHKTGFGCEARCLVLVYDRYLKQLFRGTGGWVPFIDYCDTVCQIYECLPNVLSNRIMGLPGYSRTICQLRNTIIYSVSDYNGSNDLTMSETHYLSTRYEKS